MKIKPGLSTDRMSFRFKGEGHEHDFSHREQPILGSTPHGKTIIYGYRFICRCGAEIVDDLSQPLIDRDTLVKLHLMKVET